MSVKMTKMLIDLHSDRMDLHTQVSMLLPDMDPPEGGFPVLYLLHGKGGDHTDWTRLAPMEHYVRERFPLCLVMPSCEHSFYRNMAYGLPWYDYVAQELPQKLGRMFPLSQKREETFVCGGSMGGYGAMLLALNRPERFGWAASISGALDAWEMIRDREWPEWEWIFGEGKSYQESTGDLVYMLGKVQGEKPHLFVCCGLEDGLIGQNRTFVNRARELGYDISFREGHGGHDWFYRNRMIRQVLDWLPLKKGKM